MAALHYAAAATSTASLHHCYRRLTPKTLNPRKPVFLISCSSTSFTTKPTRRKNHLREKILKTLKEPIIPKLPPANPVVPIDSPPQEINENDTIQEIRESDKSENSETGNKEVQKVEELREVEVSMPTRGGVDGSVGVSAKYSMLNYGLWLLGAFVFQTVCAIWVFGSAGVDNENQVFDGDEKSSVLEVEGNVKGKSRVKAVLNGNGNGKMGVGNSVVGSIVYVDELEMERKIDEIRAMARDAREKERLESKKNDLDSEDGEEMEGGKYFRSGIEEEVDNRLINLKKKLENMRGKMPVASVGYLRKDAVEKSELDKREGAGALLFKKKYKFKDFSGDPIKKPKGFIGSDDNKVNKSEESGDGEKVDKLFKGGNDDNHAVSLGDGEKQQDLSGVDPKESDAANAVEEVKKKGVSEMTEFTISTKKKVAKGRAMSNQGKGKRATKPKMTDGNALEKNNGRSALEAVKRRKSSAWDVSVESNELSKGNDSLKGKGVGDAQLAVKSESDTDFWWLNLPYVLAILMQRGHDGAGGEGLYTLKSISSTKDQTSHMVAFEDRSDATNFCYLLQAFFEDLEDFRADVVPLTVKELNEAVKSYTMRVIVVKRGQLKLYAGQPLADAETALCAMIKQH